MHNYQYVINPKTNIPVIKELEEEYEQKGKYNEYLNKFFITTEDEVRPLSIFLFDYIPSEWIDEEAPTGIFSDIDDSSEFIDPEYDPNDDEFMNIDKSLAHDAGGKFKNGIFIGFYCVKNKIVFDWQKADTLAVPRLVFVKRIALR